MYVIKFYNIIKSGEVKYINCIFLTRLLYRISVFKSIAIILPCVTMCSYYQCIVDYPCGCANYFIIINVYILFYILIIINALQYNRERT